MYYNYFYYFVKQIKIFYYEYVYYILYLNLLLFFLILYVHLIIDYIMNIEVTINFIYRSLNFYY